MINYFEEIEYSLDKISFHFLDGIYTGRGLMTWNPEKGFHIDAFVERKGPDLPSPIPFGEIGFISKKDTCSIRMKSKSFTRAIIPYAILNDHMEIIWDGRLSFNSSKIIIFNRYKNEISKKVSGSVLLKTKGDLILSIPVKTSMKVGDEKEQIGFKSIISYKSEGHCISGENTKKNHLFLNFNLCLNKWSRNHCWRWAEAARYALSIITGQNICLLHRKITRGNQTIEEIRKPREIVSLDIFTPLEYGKPIIQDLFVKLTEFFMSENKKNAKKIRVCKNIFNQLIEASRQKTHQGKELLISTILEAALRTFDNHPFKEGDRSWKLRKSLENFRKIYLSDVWVDSCNKAVRSHINLRNRNAHPDWLFRKGGSLSDKALSKSLDDMIFLCRFYGYMILALAGFKNLEPQFPLPHKEWKPMATISTIEKK